MSAGSPGEAFLPTRASSAARMYKRSAAPFGPARASLLAFRSLTTTAYPPHCRGPRHPLTRQNHPIAPAAALERAIEAIGVANA